MFGSTVLTVPENTHRYVTAPDPRSQTPLRGNPLHWTPPPRDPPLPDPSAADPRRGFTPGASNTTKIPTWGGLQAAGAHTKGPQKSPNAQFEVHGLDPRPQFHEKTSRKRQKERTWWRESEKKRNFGRSGGEAISCSNTGLIYFRSVRIWCCVLSCSVEDGPPWTSPRVG